jgi:hypothetical protein
MIQPQAFDRLAERVTTVMHGRLGVSRALPPGLKGILLDIDGAIEFPALRGQTVVPDDWDGSVVLGHPNYFGRFEPRARESIDIRLTGSWAALDSVPPDARVIEVDDPAPVSQAEAALAAARRLAKRLQQLRGVQIAVRPQSPIVVALVSKTIRSGDMGIAGVSVLGAAFPEFPGGVRIEIPADAIGGDIVRYADDLERRVAREART